MISLIIGIILIKMTILFSVKVYNLTSGVPKNLLNIKENTQLSFYIRATLSQQATTTITVNNDVAPFNLITTSSYKSLNSNSMNTINRIIFFKKNGNQMVTHDEYSVSNNDTNYIGIHFMTNKNISYLSITTTVGGKFYDLSAGLTKSVRNLLPSFPYTFRLPVKEGQRKINVTLAVINDTTKPFDYAYVDEYPSEKGRPSTRVSLKIANGSPKKNNLILSFYHIIWKGYNISYIDVVFEPKKKIKNLKIRIYADYCFDLNDYYTSKEIYPKNLTNLKANIDYYLHFYLKYLQHANLTLSMNKMPSQPFNAVYISHYEDKSNAFPKNYSSQNVTFEEENNKLVTNLTIHNNINNTHYFTIKFRPSYDIDKIHAILAIGGVPTIEYKVIPFNGS